MVSLERSFSFNRSFLIGKEFSIIWKRSVSRFFLHDSILSSDETMDTAYPGFRPYWQQFWEVRVSLISNKALWVCKVVSTLCKHFKTDCLSEISSNPFWNIHKPSWKEKTPDSWSAILGSYHSFCNWSYLFCAIETLQSMLLPLHCGWQQFCRLFHYSCCICFYHYQKMLQF